MNNELDGLGVALLIMMFFICIILSAHQYMKKNNSRPAILLGIGTVAIAIGLILAAEM